MVELSWKTTHPLPKKDNMQAIREKVNLKEEITTFVSLMRVVVNKAIATKHNRVVEPQSFQLGDLVLKQTNVWEKNTRDGKLVDKWE